MTKLLTKEKFHWTDATEAAFNQLKQALTTPHTLCLSDFSQPFVVECDASGLGIGAVLPQNSHPVAYFSATLKGTSLTLSTYEKEMLAIVKAIQKWRHYLLGKRVQTIKASSTCWSSVLPLLPRHSGFPSFWDTITLLSIRRGLRIRLQTLYHV